MATVEGPRRHRHVVRWLSCGVALVLVVVAVVAATRPNNEAASFDSPLIGHHAPPLSAHDFAGQLVSLQRDRGNVVIVNFFGSWCPPCQTEEPNLAQLSFDLRRKHHPRIELVSVDIDDSTPGARQFVRLWHITWPAVPDHAGQYAAEFGVTGPPMTFFIDPHGVVVGVLSGPATYEQLAAGVTAAQND